MRLGAGAFVCGEETALIASLEDQIGEPRPKPPFPANSGLWGKPTNINNVETWATVPKIIMNGAQWFASIGTEKSKGTKIFSLVGKINNTGLVEVPMGIPLREIIYDIGGGIPNNKQFKAVQTGGPSGGCIPLSRIDTPVDYENLAALGSIVGSGGMVVMDEDTCMVDIAKFFVSFCLDESCGQCTPCREGTKLIVKLLDEIVRGRGTEGHIATLEELCLVVKEASLCGLGKTAPNPVLSTLRYFRDEYDAHIRDKKCPAGCCRLCVVEAEGPMLRRSLATSCNLRVSDGLSAETESSLVKTSRKVIFELLLGRAPDSKPLIEMAKRFGVEATRFKTGESDDCVRCGLCVRVCRDTIGVSAISFAGRGQGRRVTAEFGKLSGTCIGCGACANICPTGAIRLEDKGNERKIFLWGAILSRQELVKCEGCGTPHITQSFLDYILSRTGIEDEMKARPNRCPDCSREHYALALIGRLSRYR